MNENQRKSPAQFLSNRMLEMDVYDFVFQYPSEEKILKMASSSEIYRSEINPIIQETYRLLLYGLRYEEFKSKLTLALGEDSEDKKIIYGLMNVYNTYRSLFPREFPQFCFVLATNIAYGTQKNSIKQ